MKKVGSAKRRLEGRGTSKKRDLRNKDYEQTEVSSRGCRRG